MVMWFNAGVDRLARYLTGQDTSDTISLVAKLYTNPLILTNSTVFANFVECSFFGYAAQRFSGLTWSGSSAAGEASYQANPVQMNLANPGPDTINLNGWYVIDEVLEVAMYGDSFVPPYPIPPGTSSIALTIPFEVTPPAS